MTFVPFHADATREIRGAYPVRNEGLPKQTDYITLLRTGYNMTCQNAYKQAKIRHSQTFYPFSVFML